MLLYQVSLGLAAFVLAATIGLSPGRPGGGTAAAKPTEIGTGASEESPTGATDDSRTHAQQEREGQGAEAAPPKEAHHLVWGEAVDGLQAGVGFYGSDRRTYRIGEVVPLVVKLRNVSSAPITFTYSAAPFQYVRPRVKDAAGEPIRVYAPAVRYLFPDVKHTLKPGAQLTLGVGRLKLASNVPARISTPHLVVPPGKYTVSYTAPVHGRDGLATGQLELAVKAAEVTANEE